MLKSLRAAARFFQNTIGWSQLAAGYQGLFVLGYLVGLGQIRIKIALSVEVGVRRDLTV